MTEDDYETRARRDAERRAFVQKRLSEMLSREYKFEDYERDHEDDEGTKELSLIAAIKTRLPELKQLRDSANAEWLYEDGVYRFYHGSFKVFVLQDFTERVVELILNLAPDRMLDRRFLEIMAAGTSKEFRAEKQEGQGDLPRHIVEAYFHARYFVEMLCKYGEHAAELEESVHRLVQIIARRKREKPPYPLFEGDPLPSGWAAVLELFHLR